MSVNKLLLIFCLLVVSTFSFSSASAIETFFYIVKKSDWVACTDLHSYQPVTFSNDGFITLLTSEQIANVSGQYPFDEELLLLEINFSSSDPQFKWENVPGNEGSLPRYYGRLPKSSVKKIFSFKSRKDGKIVLPKNVSNRKVFTQVIPKRFVTKFLNYQDWQNCDRLHKLQEENFTQPKVRLQWWYFDFFLDDGSTVVLTFIPQYWWDDTTSTDKKAVFTLSLITKEGMIKRFSTSFPQSEIITSANHLEIPDRFSIRSNGQNDNYSINVNLPEVKCGFTITPTQLPFAPFPTGVMPGFLQALLGGASIDAPKFSYVSQVPNGSVSGSLNWEEYKTEIIGQAYHEQGRLDNDPAKQGGSWTWYHFTGDGWNIFGTPGAFIYVQHDDNILRSGFPLITKNHKFKNKTFSSPQHKKIVTGGEINFQHEELNLQLTISPNTSKTIACFPSLDPNQVWGTVEGATKLSITDGTTTTIVEGRMLLETCSWETSDKKGKL